MVVSYVSSTLSMVAIRGCTQTLAWAGASAEHLVGAGLVAMGMVSVVVAVEEMTSAEQVLMSMESVACTGMSCVTFV